MDNFKKLVIGNGENLVVGLVCAIMICVALYYSLRPAPRMNGVLPLSDLTGCEVIGDAIDTGHGGKEIGKHIYKCADGMLHIR